MPILTGLMEYGILLALKKYHQEAESRSETQGDDTITSFDTTFSRWTTSS